MSRGGKKSGAHKGLWKKIFMVAFVAVNVLSIALMPAQPALAASFTFTQNDWAVSADSSATAGHTGGAAQTGVTSFTSTSSAYLTTGANLTIATSSGSFMQTDWTTVNATDSRTHTEELAAPGAWTKASTTDAQIDYSATQGKLGVTNNSLTHTTDSDFNGTHSATATSGGSVVFSETTATPIVRGTLPTAPVGLGAGAYSALDVVDANTAYVAERRRDSGGSYYDVVVHKTTDGGASWTNTTAIPHASVLKGEYISLKAVDANTVFISHISHDNGILYFAKSIDGGATWTTATVDGSGNPRNETSITATSASNAFISYYDGVNADLKFATSTDGGINWTTSTVDSTGNVGRYSSIEALDASTLFISYYDATNTILKLAKSVNGGQTWNLSSISGALGGQFSSLEVLDASNIVIGHYRPWGDGEDNHYDVLVAKSTNGGTSWTYTTAETSMSVSFQYVSLKAISASTFLLSYQEFSNADLRFAKTINTGANWTVSTIESTGWVGAYSSIDAVDADTVFIAYSDLSNGRTKIASSGNTATLGTYTTTSPTNLGAPVEITALALTKTAGGTAINSAGLNTYNQLGDNTTTNASTAAAVQGLTNVVSVAASGKSDAAYSLALLASGTVKAWGRNNTGQLGDGSTTQRASPVTVSGISTAVAIAAGTNHSLALLADGTIKAWGYNGSGQLGDGSTTQRTTPVTVSGISNAVAIAAGGAHSLAVLADGTVKAWGYNNYGQLGDGSTTQRTTPVTVSGITNAVSVSASLDTNIGSPSHSLAVLADGTIKAWGYNANGQLGDGSTTQRTTPVTVSGITNAVSVSAAGSSGTSGGGGYSLALLADGTAKSWGYNNYGQLGDGSTTQRTTPVAISTLTDLISISAGGFYATAGAPTHSLALKSDGTVWAWGYNGYGQFGNGGTTSSYTPVQSSVSNVTSIAAGSGFSLFVTGGSLAQIAANTDNSTWAYKGVPIQAGRASTGGISTLIGTSNQYLKYKLRLATKSATAEPSVDSLTFTYRGYPTDAGYSMISSPFNTESTTVGIGSVSWNGATTSEASLKFQVRTASSLAGLSSASWCGPTDCSGTDYFVDANNGGSIANTALTDGSNDQWFQYKTIFQTTNVGVTPTLYDVTVVYVRALSADGYTLISSPYNSGSNANVIGDVRMNVTDLPSGTVAKIQVRTAPDSSGAPGTWTGWCGPADCAGSSYWTSTGGTGLDSSTIPSALTDGTDDQWFQYRITLIPSSDSLRAPIVASAGVTYVVNTAPTVTNVVATTAATTQGATDANAGKVTVTYDLTDEATETSDTYEAYLFYDVGVTLSNDNTTTLTVSNTQRMPSSGYVQIGTEVIKYTSIVNGTTLGSLTRGSSDLSWPGSSDRHTKAYTTGSVVWIKASATTGDVGSVTEGTSRTIVWDPASEAQFADYSKYDAKVRVLVHDDNLANQLSSQSGSSTDSTNTVIIDNLAPTFSFTFDAGVAGETDTATISMSTSGPDATSTAQYMIGDSAVSHSTASSTAWTTFTTPGSKAWTFDSDFEIKTVNVQVRDPYGNAAATSTASTIMPAAASSFLVQDVSKLEISDWRLFVGWETATSTGEFASYKIEYATSTDNIVFSSYANATTPITSITTNYYVHQSLNTNLYYRYRLGVTNSNGHTSIRSSATTTAKPDGQINFDEPGVGVPPTITSVDEVAESLKATSVSIRFNAANTTLGVTNAAVYFATQTDFTNNSGQADRERYTSKIVNPGYITAGANVASTHTVVLTNLLKNTIYRYAVESCNAAGSCRFEDASDLGYEFETQNGPAVIFESISATPAYDSAVITWKTDKASDSIVFYATTGSTALVSPVSVGSSAQVTSADGNWQYVHTVHIPSLTPSTTYYYKVRSTDQNSSSDTYTQYDESTIRSFTTTAPFPPVITTAAACTTTDRTVTVTWGTDQLSTTEASLLSVDVSGNYFSTTPGAQVAQYPTGTINDASRALTDFSAQHEHTFTSLTEVTTYYLKVRSLNRSGGEVSSTLSCRTLETPKAGRPPVDPTDTIKPIIASLVIKDIKATSATIAWTTDEPADSMVKYGVTMKYGGLGGSEDMTTDHIVTISGLNPQTAYNFKAMSADERGNRAYSGDQTFTTLSVQEEALLAKEDLESLKKELEALRGKAKTQDSLQDAVQRFKAILKSVSTDVSLQDLEDLTTEITDTISEITQEVVPPAIIGGVPQVDVEANRATVTWRTNKPAGSIIALVPQDEYAPNAKDPYTLQVGQPQEEVTTHVVTVPNLEPATTYHFQIRSQAKVGPEGKSRDFVFETKAELPQILDYSFKRITENSITVAWKTNTLSNSQVRYTPFADGNLVNSEAKSQGKPEFVKDHEVTVMNLPSNTNFLIEIASADVTDATASKVIGTIRTTVDEKAPIITKVRSESTMFPGKTERTQTLIYWETDEPSTSQIFWKEGVGKGDLVEFSKLDQEYTTSHVMVITSFKPGSVYRFQVESADPSNNKGRSTDYTILTPKKGETVIDLIITNFQDIFGFLKQL